MTPCSHPRLAHWLKGSWQLGTRATPWILKHNHQIVISTDETMGEEEIKVTKEIVKKLENKKLNNLTVDARTVALSLDFEDEYQLILEPDLEDDSGLSYWELFIPTEQLLTVGSGYFWDCKSIHENS